MKQILIVLIILPFIASAQKNAPLIKSLDELDEARGTITNYWLEMGTDNYGAPIKIPVIYIQGVENGKTLGLTAAIHGDELNGIGIIHQLLETIDVSKLSGNIIAIAGLNAYALQNDQRRFIDDEDLNRNFPGKKNGHNSQQYAYKITENILPYFDFLIDMHTASFGRTNTMYARADMSNDTLRSLAEMQHADIILNSKEATAGSGGQTMRATANQLGIPSITVEYGNPQVYQEVMINRGNQGIFNTLKWLKMYNDWQIPRPAQKVTYCKKSYWIYMEEGGFLEVTVELNQKVRKGEKIAVVKNAFGEVINTYLAPEDGIVIGKSTNPSNIS
ncbi:succinylglutamate desuccinylase/aspartoacylase family protein [Fulvivirga lutimaris]|uniref:succinylglutamate desuccinylase/aspartoacylase family protein n=1 Tax=Fulvivirga lutimaris TaxID=1819566 RepID=UPI0012BD78AB|nr:succinylglutamate desuccinylase/aspartoacylase family protein [Fulvivirga lutimaris]MTI39209.1 succinylglutamate desuccinylase/aspartoacylase family protein [Fulvivirga lutimaris]